MCKIYLLFLLFYMLIKWSFGLYDFIPNEYWGKSSSKDVKTSLYAKTLTDRMPAEERLKLERLMIDLIKESKLKMRQIIDVRDDHEPYIPFHVGVIIGKVREKYRAMLDLYRQASDYRFQRYVFIVPGFRSEGILQHVHLLEYMRRFEAGIDSLVHVLDLIPEDHLKMTHNNEMLVPVREMKVVKSKGYRSRRQFEKELVQQEMIMMESDIKRRMREKFLMKKIGMPSNSTTPKKRFLNQWPVAETWDENFHLMY